MPHHWEEHAFNLIVCSQILRKLWGAFEGWGKPFRTRFSLPMRFADAAQKGNIVTICDCVSTLWENAVKNSQFIRAGDTHMSSVGHVLDEVHSLPSHITRIVVEYGKDIPTVHQIGSEHAELRHVLGSSSGSTVIWTGFGVCGVHWINKHLFILIYVTSLSVC
jgi:hypothetical protein